MFDCWWWFNAKIACLLHHSNFSDNFFFFETSSPVQENNSEWVSEYLCRCDDVKRQNNPHSPIRTTYNKGRTKNWGTRKITIQKTFEWIQNFPKNSSPHPNLSQLPNFLREANKTAKSEISILFMKFIFVLLVAVLLNGIPNFPIVVLAWVDP